MNGSIVIAVIIVTITITILKRVVVTIIAILKRVTVIGLVVWIEEVDEVKVEGFQAYQTYFILKRN